MILVILSEAKEIDRNSASMAGKAAIALCHSLALKTDS